MVIAIVSIVERKFFLYNIVIIVLLLLIEAGWIVGLVDDHESDVDWGDGVILLEGPADLFGDNGQHEGSFRRQHLVQLGQVLAYRQLPFRT